MGKLSTHVLDTACGKPAAGVAVKLYSMQNGRHLVATTVTNDDGRSPEALLAGETWRAGTYELEFAIGSYFRDSGAQHAEPPFLDDVVIRVTLSGNENYHVPLLVSPWSYSTYRGS